MRRHIIDQNGINFLTLTVVDWLDVFTRKIYKDIIIDSLQFCQKEKGLIVYAYVIMTNHIHLVVQTKEGIKLSNTLRDFKSFTGMELINAVKNNKQESRQQWMMHRFEWNAKFNKAGNRNYQFWKADNFPVALFTPKVTWQKINYIHMNPVAKGIVAKREDYCYSSASNYAGLGGMLEVELMDLYNDAGFTSYF